MSKVKLKHSSGNSMSVAAPATNPASDLELKLPATIGSANQVLRNSSTPGTLEFSDGGLADADQWRVSSNFSSADTVITSNWERVDANGSAGPLGTGMSQSSGVFTFPSTGYWLVTFMTFCAGTSADWTDVYIQATTNNSAYNTVAETRESCEDGDSHTSICSQALIDVTDKTQVKVKFKVAAASSIEWYGSTNVSKTSAVFLKLGAT
jgi:hypothetical protein